MKKSRVLFLALLLILLASAALAQEDSARMIGAITGGSLKMRTEANGSADIIDTYSKGTLVNIVETKGSWYHVEVNGRYGYMMSKYINVTKEYTHLGWAIANTDTLIVNLHSTPDAASSIIAKCFSGARFELTEDLDGWVQVRTGSDFGYIRKEDVTVTDTDYSVMNCLTDSKMYRIEATAVNTSLHAVGSQKSMSAAVGQLECSVRYPVFILGKVDAEISRYTHDLISAVSADYQQHHSASHASFLLNYSSIQLTDRYASLILVGQYTVNGLGSASCVNAYTIDMVDDRILKGEELAANAEQIEFQLRSKISRIFGEAAGGYQPPEDLDWFSHAVLDQQGITFYFLPGEILPLNCGMQKITLKYMQSADYIALSNTYLESGKRKIDPTKPMLALTFDDGPSPETVRILDVLENYGGRATFCVVGNRLNAFANILRDIAGQENEIACHTWSHQKLTELNASQIRSQIARVNDLVFELTGQTVQVLRCPYGSFNGTVKNVCAEFNMTVASWKSDTLDWSNRNTNKTYKAILKGAENGAIILMHDLYETTASAVEKAVPELIAKGYQLVTVSELLSFHVGGPVPGTVYIGVDPQNMIKP